MKTLLLICSLLLTLLSGGKHPVNAADASEKGSFRLAEASYPDTKAADFLNRDICIMASQGQSFAGEGGAHSFSVRCSQTGRRTSPQTRSTLRIIKDGKVVDNNRTHPFLTPVFVPLSGMHVSERYLLSIRRLRL